MNANLDALMNSEDYEESKPDYKPLAQAYDLIDRGEMEMFDDTI